MHRTFIFKLIGFTLILCFASQTFADDLLQLERYKGKTVYVDFWASWCVPCKKSFPWMQAMHQKYHSKGLEIIAVNLDENKKDADQFLQGFPVDFNIVHDPKGTLAEKYQLKGMPTTLVFDRNGQLITRYVGFKQDNADAYEAKIKAFLK